uniref:Uncharacterized protein n=1 Tax=Syphacia muris TaxID=451379 RepID=A0A0N5B033_9BILA
MDLNPSNGRVMDESEKQRQTKTEAYTTAQRQSRAKRQFFPGYYGLGFPGFGIGNGFAFSGPFGISLGSFRGLYFG